MASFLSEIETAILGQLTTVSGATVGLASTAQPAFITGLTIWILLTGYEVAFGKTQDSVAYLLTKLGKMCLIGWLALWGWPDISNLLSGLKDAAMGSGGSASSAIEAAVLDPLVTLWTNMGQWFANAVADLSWSDVTKFLGVFIAYIFMLMTFLLLVLIAGSMAAVSFGMFMIAQVIFALHLAVGSFFLLCLMFPFTQKFFESYIGSVMTSIFALLLTFIVLNIGANVLGLNTALSAVTGPGAGDPDASFITLARSVAVLFLAKAGAAALLIYMFFKVWDLAAALGGGINMGNNLVGGVRSILSDLASKGGKSSSGQSNSISGGGGSSGGASDRAQSANSKTNSTLTGMALRGSASAAGSVASGTLKAANAAARGVGAVGRFAYNRYSQNSNRISTS